MRLKGLPCAAALVLVSCAGSALAQPGPGAPAPAPQAKLSDALFEAAKAAFTALPEGDRKAVQDALIWTGDYNGTVAGEFGRRTFEALNAYAVRTKLPAGGMLDAPARKTLLAAAQRARDTAKFTVATDPRTGVRLGVPERILVKRDINPNAGSRWQSAEGKITLDTRAIPSGEGDLASVYERQLSTPGRQVTYKLLRPDFFVVAGETPTGKFYTRYAAGSGGLRGFSVGYEKAMAKEFDRMVLAIANSFAPFPEALAAEARRPLQDAAPAPPERPRPPRLVASGVLVDSGYVVTSAAVETCAEPRVAGTSASVVKVDKAARLALLKWPAGMSRPGLAFGTPAPTSEASLIVLSYAAVADDQVALVATPGQSSAAQILGPLQPGASGGAVVDRTGALLGTVGLLLERPRMMAGVAPPARHPFIPSETIRAFVNEQPGTSQRLASEEDRRTAGEIAAAIGRSIVAITCGG